MYITLKKVKKKKNKSKLCVDKHKKYSCIYVKEKICEGDLSSPNHKYAIRWTESVAIDFYFSTFTGDFPFLRNRVFVATCSESVKIPWHEYARLRACARIAVAGIRKGKKRRRRGPGGKRV